jgi:acyl carrier protein
MTAPSAENIIVQIASALDCDPASLTPDTGYLRHPKWDSLGHLRVMLALEKHWGLTLNESTMNQCLTIQAIRDQLSAQQTTPSS